MFVVMLSPQREVFAHDLTTKPSSCSAIKITARGILSHGEKKKLSRFIFSSVPAGEHRQADTYGM